MTLMEVEVDLTDSLQAGPDGGRESRPKKWISAQMPAELCDELARQAELEDRTKSYIIRRAIDEHLRRVGAGSDG